MSQLVRYQFWILAAACVIFFTNLGATALFDMDEALYATCSREMLERNNWVVPWFNGEMFPEKPPLMFWTMMAGYELFGVDELGARFFSAVMGVGTALIAFHLGRILFNLRVALWTGIITASTIVFTISARAATVDSALTFFTTLAFLMFVMGWKKTGELSSLPTSKSPNRPIPWLCAVAAYACIGVAVLGKGPVGMLLPLAAMGLFLLTINGWRSLFRSAWWMRPLTAIAVLSLVAVPWYILVGLETDWEWPKRFFLEFNLRPFQQPIQGHGDVSSFDRFTAVLVSFLYYFFQIPALLIGFFPWSVFLGPTAVDVIQRLRAGKNTTKADKEAKRWRDGELLALCWFGVWFVFWSICKTKLFHYLLPAYPALALMTACFIDRWLSAEGSETADNGTPFPPPWALRNAWISMILVGVGIAIAIPLLAAKVLHLPGEESLGQLGLLLVLGGAWCWWKSSCKKYGEAAITFAITSVAFLTAVFGFAAQRVDPFQNAKPVMALIRADDTAAGTTSPIATFCFFRESAVFYGKPVTKCDDDAAKHRTAQQALAEFLAKSPRSYVITTDEYESTLKKAFPGQLKIICRVHRFLTDGEIVVFRHGN